MREPIKFEDIRVDDRIRATKGSDVIEMTVTVVSDWGVGSANFVLDADGWTLELLGRPPIPEPTRLGTVVDFDDELEGLRKRVVLAGHPLRDRKWYNPLDEKWWVWKAMKNPEVVDLDAEA